MTPEQIKKEFLISELKNIRTYTHYHRNKIISNFVFDTSIKTVLDKVNNEVNKFIEEIDRIVSEIDNDIDN